MSKDFTATIKEGSARYQEWMDVLGTDVIPVRSPIPEWATAPGVEKALFYQMDLAELSQEQKDGLIKYISVKFNVDEQEVAATLDDIGCPILAEDVDVTIHNILKWI